MTISSLPSPVSTDLRPTEPKARVHPTPSRTVKQRVVAYTDRRLHVLLIVPGGLLLVGLLGYPVVFTIWASFTNKSLIYPGTTWVGFANYSYVFHDSEMWSSVVRTFTWTFASVAGQLLVGLAGALSLQQIRRGQAPLRMALIVPWAFPSIVMAFAWKFMLDPLYGVTNSVLKSLGVIGLPVAWLGKDSTAMISVVTMNIWFGFPFMMVALLAGLQTIPTEHLESASVDGAGYWSQLRFIILPALKQLIGTLLVLRTIWVFNNFDFIFLTSGGGPAHATETLPLYAFNIGWTSGDLGRMSAVAVVMLAILIVITTAYLRLLRHNEAEA
jgi:multiple sugar transport system permease protein